MASVIPEDLESLSQYSTCTCPNMEWQNEHNKKEPFPLSRVPHTVTRMQIQLLAQRIKRFFDAYAYLGK